NRIFVILSFFVAILAAANYLYYNHFNSYISLSIIYQIRFLFDMQGSFASTLDFKLLFFLIPPVWFSLSMRKLKKTGYFERIGKRCIRKNFLLSIATGAICVVMVLTTLTSTDFSRLVKQWNRPYIVEQLGMYSYTIADAIKSLGGSSTIAAQLDEEEAAEFVD